MKTTDVPGTFRDMWETRPSRPRDDRMVAGVAAGIARRYDIDPVLVRVAFVVAAFSGIGAALYLFCWITFPEDPADPNAKPAARHPLALLAGGIAIAIGLGGIFDNSGSLILPPDWIESYRQHQAVWPWERLVADYIAGMTDSYAEKVYAELFASRSGSIYERD